MKLKSNTDLKTELKPAIEEFMNAIPSLGKKTRNGYEKIIDSFLSFMNTHRSSKGFPSRISQIAFAAWINSEKLCFYTITVKSHARIVVRFLRFLQNRGVLKYNSVELLLKQYPQKGLAGIVSAMIEPSPKRSLQALRRPEKFTSPLGKAMKDFIALGRAQGKRYRNEEEILARFDHFLNSYSDPPRHLSDQVLKNWIALSQSCQFSTRCINFYVVRRFCRYLSRSDPSVYIPDASLVQSKSPTLLPYVYSRAEIVAVLKAASQLKSSPQSPIRPQTYYFLILLLYTTGMRISEVLNLELRDIDWKKQSFHIREGKFYKSRIAPISDSVARELENYVKLRQTVGLPVSVKGPLFQNPHSERHLSKSVVTTTFSGILQQINVKQIAGRRRPCVHSLRHTMAVHRLEAWYQQGEDVQTKLPLLSTYLGHVRISSTQRYLTMTTELLQQASERFRRYFDA